MKKTIFDLSFKEGVELNLKIGKTSYYKQYVKGFLLSVFMLLLLGGGLVCGLFSDQSISSSTIFVSIMILIGFASLMCLLFWFKRFDLMKLYHDEENK